jgi:hypothetical protein
MLTVLGILVVAAVICAVLDKPTLAVVFLAIAVAVLAFPVK